MHTYLPFAGLKMVIWNQTWLTDHWPVTYIFTWEYVLWMFRMSVDQLCNNIQNQRWIKGVRLSTTALWKKRPTVFCNMHTIEYIIFNLKLKQFSKLKEKFNYLFLCNINSSSTLSIFFPLYCLQTLKRRQAVNLVL